MLYSFIQDLLFFSYTIIKSNLFSVLIAHKQFLSLFFKTVKKSIFLTFFLTSCGGKFGSDARKISPDPKERVRKNLEEGKGFRLNDLKGSSGGTTYEFASSNELWRASLDTIDFMPLTTANYNGGIIVTDWYSENESDGETV